MIDNFARQAVSGPNIPTLTIVSYTAWNQRTSDHFQKFAKAKHIQRTEYVRGDSSSASARSFIPKVNVGVAPYEGAATTERKGSVVPKIAVGVAQRGGRHRPRPRNLSPSPLTRQTRRTPKSKLSRRQSAPRHQLLPPIQWRAIQSSHRLEL